MTLAVIGGSGIYAAPDLVVLARHEIQTPYGMPSGPVIEGTLDGQRVLFLARHGAGHHIPPHRVNYRANICALKQLGATQLVSLSAVGSLREEIVPGQVVVVDQFVDWTRGRIATFFEDGIAAHVSFADPVDAALSLALAEAATRAGAPLVHRRGTYICMEGPQFSTRAESHLYRSWGVDVIGMTAMPEAKLAREAQLPYALLALATDYDCWREEEAVDVDRVIATVKANAALSLRTVRELLAHLPDAGDAPAARALTGAVITDPRHVTSEARERLAWLLSPLSPA